MGVGMHLKQFAVKEDSKVRLADFNPGDTSAFDGDKKAGEKAINAIIRKLDPLQELLYAEHRHKLLIVLQGMDYSGKDGTIRRVFEGVNPEGVRAAHLACPRRRSSTTTTSGESTSRSPARERS